MRILILLFISFKVFSQDTISFRNGESKTVKIEEVGVGEIKFRNFSNVDGPIYIANKSEVLRIKYKGGHIDTFALSIPKPTNSSEFNKPIKRLSIEDKRTISYNGIPLGKKDLEDVLSAYPNLELRSKLIEMNTQLSKHTRIASTAVGLGFGFGFGIPVATSIIGTFIWFVNAAYGGNDQFGPNLIIGGIIVGAVLRTTGVVIQKVNQNKAIKIRKQIVDLYNEGMK